MAARDRTDPMDTTPSVLPEGYLIYLVKQVEGGLRRPFEALLGAHDMSVGGFTALNVLQNRPGITSSELARRSFVRAQSMAETVTSLTSSGLVRREKDPRHGRQILLFLTEAGAERIASVAPEVHALQDRLTEGLDADEVAALVRALRVCRDTLASVSQS